MAKLHKIELYVVDPNESYKGAMDIFYEIDRKLYDGVPIAFKTDTVEIDWDDNIDINKTNATNRVFERYLENKEIYD